MPNEIKAVLVSLSVRIFSNGRTDKDLTDEVRVRKSLGVGAGKWIKNIFPKEALEPIQKHVSSTRIRHYEMTLPWEDGTRMVTATALDSYRDQIQHQAHAAFWKLVDTFGEAYPAWIDQARVMHGKTFDKSLYPAWREMRSRHFGYGVEFTPMPKASHFVQGLAKDALDEMRTELEQRTAVHIDEAVKNTWERLLTPVRTLADTLARPEQTFRDSLVQNVRDIVAMIPLLNLTDDSALRTAAQAINEKFNKMDPDLLRRDLDVRKAAINTARAIAEQFGKTTRRFA